MSSDQDERPKKSHFAQELEGFQNSLSKVIKERDRLPQPLFWSLFGSKLKELKERKASDRRLSELLSGLD